MLESHSHFGQLMQEARLAAGLSRIALAKRLGLDPSHIYRLERGDRRPSRECALALAEGLGIGHRALDGWLLSAGYAPVTLPGAVRGAVRTRGGGRPPGRDTEARPEWRAGRRAAALDALGLGEARVGQLLQAMEAARPEHRHWIARAVSATLSRAYETLTVPVRKAVIPAAGRHHQLVALPIMQRLLLGAMREAADSGISELILVLAPGAVASLYQPLEEALNPALAPFVRLGCVEQPVPLGLGDAILRSEPHVGSEPFAVLLPDDVLRERTGPTAQPRILRRMMSALAGLGNAHLVVVTAVPKSRMSRYGAVKVAAQEPMPGIHPIAQMVEKPEADHPILRSARTLGIVGRYLLGPDIFAALRTIGERGDRPVEITAALDLVRQSAGRVFAFDLRAARQDLGEALGQAEAIIDASLRGTRHRLNGEKAADRQYAEQ